MLSKFNIPRLGFLIIVDMLLVGWCLYNLGSKFSWFSLVFLTIYVIHAVMMIHYVKTVINKVLDEKNLPEIQKVQQAAILMDLRAEEGSNNAAAAAA